MAAYNFFVSGWVNTLYMRHVGSDKVVVFGRVSEEELIKFVVPCLNIFTACYLQFCQWQILVYV